MPASGLNGFMPASGFNRFKSGKIKFMPASGINLSNFSRIKPWFKPGGLNHLPTLLQMVPSRRQSPHTTHHADIAGPTQTKRNSNMQPEGHSHSDRALTLLQKGSRIREGRSKGPLALPFCVASPVGSLGGRCSMRSWYAA